MIRFAYREWHSLGGQRVSPLFDTPTEAGRWRRDNPPLRPHSGPTLIRVDEAGNELPAAGMETIEAIREFADHV